MANDPSPGPVDVANLPPGAKVPEDAIDSELIRLPLPQKRRHPGVALAVFALGCLLCYRLKDDVRYALQPSPPLQIGQASAADLQPGRFVRLRGMPDHRNTLAFDRKGERARSQLFRLLGTGSGLLVLTGSPFDQERFDNEWQGRLRRFDDLPYAATVRSFYRDEAKALRSLDLTALFALPAGPLPAPLSTRDRGGEAVTVPGDGELSIRVRFPDDLRILLAKAKFPSEGDARYEAERLGAPLGPGVPTEDGYGYVLRTPQADAEGRARLLSLLEQRAIPFVARVETYRVKLAQVERSADGLSLPGEKALPQPTRYRIEGKALAPEVGARTLLEKGAIDAVEIAEPLLIAPTALVLISDEIPGKLWWTLPVFGMLLIFLGFNLWYLIRVLQERRDDSNL